MPEQKWAADAGQDADQEFRVVLQEGECFIDGVCQVLVGDDGQGREGVGVAVGEGAAALDQSGSRSS